MRSEPHMREGACGEEKGIPPGAAFVDAIRRERRNGKLESGFGIRCCSCGFPSVLLVSGLRSFLFFFFF